MKLTSLCVGFLVVLALIGCGGSVKPNPKYNYITADETAKLIRENASSIVLVDIQEKDGAMNR